MAKQKFTPLTKFQVDYANRAVRWFLSDLEKHGVHIVYDTCDGEALFVPADFVNTYAEDGCVEFGNDILAKINVADTPIAQPWNGWLTDEDTDPDTHRITRWSIGVNTKWKEAGETGTEVPADPKYEFTGETKKVEGHTLHRIRALRKITDPAEGWEIKKGDLGGWIESEKNLSHEGAAWVDCDACVYGDAKVYGNAYAGGNARVYDSAKVFGDAMLYEDAEVYGNARVYGNADVFGDSYVHGNAQVCGDTHLCGEIITEGTHGTPTDEPGETAEPETEETLTHRMTVLEGRVDKLADEMKATVKDIKEIKKQIAKKPKTAKNTPKKTKKTKKSKK